MKSSTVGLLLSGLSLGISAASVWPGPASAQTYPHKVVRFVVPFAPGGSTDLMARAIGQKLSERLGQPIIVENRPGASGTIGTTIAAQATPDGYTLLAGTAGPLTYAPILQSKLAYNARKDFAAVSLAFSAPMILGIHPSLPAKSVREFVALAKSKPGEIDYATVGAGSSQHLTMELLAGQAGIAMVAVHYKSSAPSLTDLLGGHVKAGFFGIIPALPHVTTGKLRPLGVTTVRRSTVLPNVPTIAESGFPGFDTSQWFGVLVPAKTPQPIIAKLHAEIVAVLRSPEVEKRLSDEGAHVVASTPAEFSEHLMRESEKWTKVIRQAGIQIQ
ncbi:MAG: tripartite tricarboxylate transporter substrate binding protein [Betaproteobacteria bacterium]|nr:tripartite tricarboxylate transporter substrate binding protein [Betaproteobacteria bacterium]